MIKGGLEPCVCLQGLCQMWRVLHRNLVRQAEEAALLPDVLGYVALVVLRESLNDRPGRVTAACDSCAISSSSSI